MGDLAEVAYLLALLRVQLVRLHGRDRERGAVTTETVIIVAGLAALALAVVAIIVKKVTDKATSIKTD